MQLAGDGLLAATALIERDWDGDAELARELHAVVGDGPPSGVRPLPVDLDELAGTLEDDPLNGGGRIDLRTGDVWPELVFGDSWDEEPADDEERWLHFDSEGSSAGYRDMEEFAATARDARLARRLDAALTGRGAFRRFRDVLGEDEAELTRWHAFSEERTRGRARLWLAQHGLRPVPAA